MPSCGADFDPCVVTGDKVAPARQNLVATRGATPRFGLRSPLTPIVDGFSKQVDVLLMPGAALAYRWTKIIPTRPYVAARGATPRFGLRSPWTPSFVAGDGWDERRHLRAALDLTSTIRQVFEFWHELIAWLVVWCRWRRIGSQRVELWMLAGAAWIGSCLSAPAGLNRGGGRA